MSEVLVFTLDQSGELIEEASQAQGLVQVVPTEQHAETPVTADFSHVEINPFVTFGIVMTLGVAGIRHLLRPDIRMTQHSNEHQS